MDEKDEADEIYVDGNKYNWPADFTFREQREIRKLIIELSGELVPGDMDIAPAVITVIKRREDESFTVEQALDLKPEDPPATRPTRGRKK